MVETVAFPKLGLEFAVNSIAFQFGNFAVHWYGIILALGLLAGMAYALWRAPRFGVDPDRMIDVVLVGTIGSIIGARAYYVAFSWDYYREHLSEIFQIWNGGIAIYGAIIGAFLAGLVMCKIRKVKILPMFDLAAGGFLLGQGIGRWGNFVNIEAFGGNTDNLFGMTSQRITNYLLRHQDQLEAIGMDINPYKPVHPTFLYESVWCLVGFLILAFVLTRFRRFDGSLFLFYIAWYSLGRYNIEGLRTDSLMIGGHRVSQMLALFAFIAAFVTWLVVRIKIFRRNDPEYLRLDVLCQQEAALRAAIRAEEEGRPRPSSVEPAGEPETGETVNGEESAPAPEESKEAEEPAKEQTEEEA